MILLRNKATKKEYPVSNADWEEMKRKGKGKLFEVVREVEERPLRVAKPEQRSTAKMPPVPPVVERVERTESNKGPDAGHENASS